MGVEREDSPKPLHIARYKPSDLTMDDYHERGLVELMTRGYGVPVELGEKRAEEEFGGDDSRKDIFLASDGTKAIGALILINWSEVQPKRGKPFWERLRELNPELVQNAQSYSPYACDIGGTVTLPEYRGQGIMRKLIRNAEQEFRPSIIVGRTKTVEAVNSRARSWEGMNTYYGSVNVTPGADPHDNKSSQELIEAYVFARQPEEVVDENGIIYVSSDFLPPTIPDVSHVSSNIQLAFDPIINRQQELNLEGTQTALFPLISITREAFI